MVFHSDYELTLIFTVAVSVYVLKRLLVKVQSPKPLVSMSQTEARAKCQPAAELINAFQERRQRRRGWISCHPNKNKYSPAANRKELPLKALVGTRPD